MTGVKSLRPLPAGALYHKCKLGLLRFESTHDLEPLPRPLGQQRALDAIALGVEIDDPDFNLFVFGMPGLGKHELVRRMLAERAAAGDSPGDWCYVNNFDNPQKPRVLKLPAGLGRKLRDDMKSLVEDLLTSLPSSFQSEEYRNRRQAMEKELQDQQEQAFVDLNQRAEEQGIAMLRTPAGYSLGPMRHGRLLDNDQFERLPEADRTRIEALIEQLQAELQELVHRVPLMQREFYQQVKALNREITEHTVTQLMAWIEKAYRDQPDVVEFLAQVKLNAIENVEAFLPRDNAIIDDNIARRVDEFHQFQVNVIVDNQPGQGAPVVYEDNPTFQNLLGRIEYQAEMGAMLTDFTLIKPGALHRANGGYLIIDALNLLSHGFAWEGLKRVMKAREIRIQSLERMLSLASSLSPEPEPIPLDVKVVLIGGAELYYLLQAYDREFSRLFKVAADFSASTERSGDNVRGYARLIASIQRDTGIMPLDRRAVARLIEQASRAVDDTERLSLRVDGLRDLLIEADHWAGRAGRRKIGLADVEQTIERRDYRRSKVQQLMEEQVLRGLKLIDSEDSCIGQVNALAVLQIGDYRFGQVSRVTATARMGRGQVIDIERESRLGGEIHSKGVMILSAYLADRFAADRALPLSATLVFEQSYGMIDGDSASAVELCALLSAIGRIPLTQTLAVTGSINQLGEMQPIGGVNEKIEGFFRICEARGLTGEQGVIIPRANRVHLMLGAPVREAVAAGRFAVYCAEHVDQVMWKLSGLRAGEANAEGRFPRNSFNLPVQQRLDELAKRQREQRGQPQRAED